MEKVSLYIPCFNASNTIEKTLNGVLQQTYPIDEIIIVDDGSSDNTIEITSKYNVRIIRHKENKGLASARNTGVLNSKNEYIASLDSDCIPDTDWLEKLMEDLSRDTVAGTGGRLVEVNVNTIADQWRAAHLAQNWGNKTVINPRYLYGNNILFKKNTLTEVGLYNPKYKTNSEDYDISRRLIDKGYTLIYNPKARVKHIRTDTISSAMNTYCKYYYFGYIRKVNISNTIRGILTYLFFSASFFIKDLLSGKIDLLHLDILSFIFSIKKILRAMPVLSKNTCKTNPF